LAHAFRSDSNSDWVVSFFVKSGLYLDRCLAGKYGAEALCPATIRTGG